MLSDCNNLYLNKVIFKKKRKDTHYYLTLFGGTRKPNETIEIKLKCENQKGEKSYNYMQII